VATNVTRHLPAASRVPDVDGVVQVEVLGQLGQVVGLVIHVVAVANLRGAAMPSPVTISTTPGPIHSSDCLNSSRL
jgi:hypothetical protein